MEHDHRDDPDEALLASAVCGAGRLDGATSAVRERVRAAVHSEWRAALADAEAAPVVSPAAASGPAAASRRARWPVALAAAILLALVGGSLLWLPGRPGGGESIAIAAIVRGTVLGERPTLLGPRHAALPANAPLAAGDVIATGEDGAALLRLGPGLNLRLAANTRLAFRSGGSVALEAGRIYLDADSRLGLQSLEIVTEFGTVRHLGTQYLLNIDSKRLEVSVREGLVQVGEHAGTQAQRVQAGESLRIEATGAIERSAVAQGDPRWNWLAALPAPFALDGATLGEFLDWYERETGRQIAFAQPADAARARAIALRGSIAGLPPGEALRVVVASAGLGASLNGGGVLIRPD